MTVLERAGLALLHRLDPERAHDLSLKALQLGLAPLPQVLELPRLRTSLAGIDLANPLGLAAGYDKNAVAVAPLLMAGFGFVEVGAVTPRPQPGNPRPRLFRLPEAGAVINRFGFNNEGAEAVARRLARRPEGGIIGINLGANRDSPDRAADYGRVLALCGPHVDFATINVSSPNTERLRELQGRDALTGIIARTFEAREALRLDRPLPIFIKIAPDLTEAEIADIAAVALENGVDGIIATNTTIARPGVSGPVAAEKGGLSGRPLFRRSTQVLARLHRETGGRLPLIGVGGIASPEDAWQKIRAGASALQIYTALVYRGLSLVPRILAGLDAILAREGFASLSEAVGTGREEWADRPLAS